MKMSNRILKIIAVFVAFIIWFVIIEHTYYAESRNFADMKIEKEYSFTISNIVEFPGMRRDPNALFVITTDGDSILLYGLRINSTQKYLDEVVSIGYFVFKKENEKIFEVKSKGDNVGNYQIFNK